MNFELVIVVICQIFGKGGYHCTILIGTNSLLFIVSLYMCLVAEKV